MSRIYIENAVKYSEDNPSAEVLEHYGDILFKTGEEEKALEQWRKAKELGSDSKTLDKKIKTKKYTE
jgi:predicted negative regulator of RcsB-dependent stress response